MVFLEGCHFILLGLVFVLSKMTLLFLYCFDYKQVPNKNKNNSVMVPGFSREFLGDFFHVQKGEGAN